MEMKVLVCGSRNWIDELPIRQCLLSLRPSLVIEGAARGADSLAAKVARSLHIPVREFPAQWEKFGRSAGYRRNLQMLLEGKPDLVVAFPLGVSSGTWNMVAIARKAGVPVKVFGQGGLK